MSVLSISFEPVIERTQDSATDAWIDSLDWDVVHKLSKGVSEVDVSFAVDGQRFGYYPDSAGGVLGELATSLRAIRSGCEMTFAVQTYTVLRANRVGDGWQFYDPVASYEGGVLKPLERQRLIGDPVSQAAVDAVLREAIAAVGRYIGVRTKE